MKIGVYADAHFSYSSSILASSSDRYSTRLDTLVDTFEWMYQVFEDRDVDMIVSLGDLTSNPHLRAEEISALNKALSYSKGTQEYHILGNHEILSNAKSKSKINSVNILDIADNIQLVTEPMSVQDVILFPFPQGENEEIAGDLIDWSDEGNILLSHLNILSEELMRQFDMTGVNHKVLKENYELVVNGHIHKSEWVTNNVVNIGSLMGVDFGDEYHIHYPSVGIIDTDESDVNFVENPHAVRFVRLSPDSLYDLKESLNNLDDGKYALNLEVDYDIKDDVREVLESYDKVTTSRVRTKVNQVFTSELDDEKVEKITSFESGVDAFKSFIDYINEPQYPKETMKKVIDELHGG